MSNEQIALNADRATLDQVLPLSDFLKKQIELTTDAEVKKAFESHLEALRYKWKVRMSPEQRAKGLEQVAKLRELISINVKDNRNQYRSKLANLGGAQ